jgi:hypothetical protein
MRGIFRDPFRGFNAYDRCAIAYLVAFVFLIIGYVLNIIKVLAFLPPSFAEATPLYILRVISIFAAPLGGVLGWF